METFDVAAENRSDTNALHEPIQIQDHTGLIAIRVREHDPGLVGPDLEDRPHGSIQLCVHGNDMLAVADRFEHDGSTELHRPRDFDHGVHLAGPAQREGILRHHVAPALDGRLDLRGGRGMNRVLHARLRIGLLGLGQRAVGDPDQFHPWRVFEDL